MQMYPKLSYEYDIYGFLRPDKDAPFYGISPNPDRTYKHLTRQQRADLVRELDIGIAEPGEDGDALTQEDVANEKKPPCSSKDAPIPHTLKAGCQGYTRRHQQTTSCLSVLKTSYRLDYLGKTIRRGCKTRKA